MFWLVLVPAKFWFSQCFFRLHQLSCYSIAWATSTWTLCQFLLLSYYDRTRYFGLLSTSFQYSILLMIHSITSWALQLHFLVVLALLSCSIAAAVFLFHGREFGMWGGDDIKIHKNSVDRVLSNDPENWTKRCDDLHRCDQWSNTLKKPKPEISQSFSLNSNTITGTDCPS